MRDFMKTFSHLAKPSRRSILFQSSLILFLFHMQIGFAQLPVLSWVTAAGNCGNDPENFLHGVDSSGNVYVSGAFSDASMDFDTGAAVYTIPYSGYGDIFVAKYDPQGGILWAFSIGTNNSSPSTDIIYCMEVTPAGDIYLGGRANQGADFDPGSGTFQQPTGTFGFIAKYNSQGALVWCNPLNILARALVVDNNGDLGVTGSFDNTVDFDPSAGVNSHTSTFGSDIFLAKYSSSGSLIWVIALLTTYPSTCIDAGGWSIDNDSQNNFVIWGIFRSVVDFNPGNGTNTLQSPTTTTQSHFMAKYSSAGNYVWAFQLDLSIYVSFISIDTSDNIVLGMTFGGSADIDPGAGVYTFSSSDPGDIGMIKYSSAGTPIWAKCIAGSGVEYFEYITTNNNSEILITGEIINSVDFDPGPGQYNVAPHAYIAKYDAQGNLLWAFSATNSQADRIIETPDQSIYWVGKMSYVADFDPNSNIQFNPGFNSYGVFVAKYSPPALAVAEHTTKAISIYPNPAQEYITINSEEHLTGIEIRNACGEIIQTHTTCKKQVRVNVNMLSPGIYFVFAVSSTGTSCSPLVINR